LSHPEIAENAKTDIAVNSLRSVVELDINCAIATSLLLGKLGTYIIDCITIKNIRFCSFVLIV